MTIIMLLTAAPYPKRLKFKYCGKRSHILYVRLKTLLSVSSANSISEKKIMASNFKNDTVFYILCNSLCPQSPRMKGLRWLTDRDWRIPYFCQGTKFLSLDMYHSNLLVTKIDCLKTECLLESLYKQHKE